MGTATFTNVPPGRYQIVVNKFANKGGPPINDANPRITIRIGAKAVFECRIPSTCDRRQHIWNVANILIEEDGSKSDMFRYRFEILDIENKMIPIDRATMPSTDQKK